MTRYFEDVRIGAPMVELTEAEALESGTYVVEDEPALRRYRVYFNGKLSRLTYLEWEDPSRPLDDLKGRNLQARIESSLQTAPEGGTKWRTWYVDAAGTITKIMEQELDDQGRAAVMRMFTPAGELTGYSEYHYTTYGELVEVVSHNPDGSVRNVHAAPL